LLEPWLAYLALITGMGQKQQCQFWISPLRELKQLPFLLGVVSLCAIKKKKSQATAEC
jgi:hypothetical protein